LASGRNVIEDFTMISRRDKKKKAPRSGSLPNALFLSSSGTRYKTQ